MKPIKALKTSMFIVSAVMIMSVPAQAESRYELGLRADIRIGSGFPANDIPGGALVLRYKLDRPGWWIGGAIDSSPVFDVEYPQTRFDIAVADIVGEPEDAEASSTMLTIFAERQYRSNNKRLVPFWGVGAGFNSIDVTDLSGETENGRMFNLSFDTGTEIVLEATIGARFEYSDAWSSSISGLIQHRIADWTITDTVSSDTQTIDDYTVSGIYIGLINYRF